MEVSKDHLLGGRVRLRQAVDGYRAGLDADAVQHVDVMRSCGSDVDNAGNGTAYVEQRVQLDAALPAMHGLRPREHGQAQIDRGRVERVDSLVEIEAEWFIGVQPSGDGDQRVGELRVDPPVACFIGVGQG